MNRYHQSTFMQRFLRTSWRPIPFVVMLFLLASVLVRDVSAHYLNMTQAWALMDQDTMNMIAARAAANDQPLIRSGDEITLIMKAFPSDGTTFGAGGYMSLYIPPGTQVTDVGYVFPNGSGGYNKIPVKNPSPTDDNAGDRGPDTIPQLVGVNYGPNAIGRTELAVDAGGVTRGTLAGVMGDTGVFYSTDPRTSWDSWYRNIGTARTYCTNPNGDCRVSSQTNGLTRPSTAWDAFQVLAYGSDSVGADVDLPFTTNGPLIDPSGHGSTAWGLANAVAGPQSGYMQGFDLDIWDGTRSNTNFRAALANAGPWQRIQYPGSTISDDRKDPTNDLAVSVQDASLLGRNIVANPLPPTLSHTDSTSPKAIRISVGGIEQGRLEYISVTLRVLESPGSPNPNPYDANGCFEAHAETFAGDAGYTDNNKDHIYRYVKFSTATFNPCTQLSKRANVASAKSGDTFNYYLQFVNTGGLTIPAFTITDVVPNGLTINNVNSEYIDASTGVITTNFHGLSGQTITWNLGTPSPGGVESGDVFRATIQVTATTNGPFVNTATTNGPVLPATERIEGAISAIIVLNKAVNLGTVAPGSTVRYTLQANNLGSGPTQAGQPIVIEDLLPPGFTYAGNPTATLNGSSVSVSVGGSSTAPIFTVTGQINANNALLISFDALIDEGVPVGTYGNSAEITYQDPSKGAQFTTCYGCAPVFVAGASIGDTIYRDWNGDGNQDFNEEGLAGVTVELLDAGNNVIDTAITDANGNYLFGGLAAGTYTVRVVGATIPSGYTLTADPVGGLDGQATVTLVNNEAREDIDFGYQPGGTGVIGDLVWHDDDRSGTQNGGEPGIPNVTVDLYEDTNNNGVIDADDALVATTVSAANGSYTFTGLPLDVNFLVDVNEFDADLTTFFGTGAYDVFSSDPHDVPGTLGSFGGVYNSADFGFDVLTPAVIGDQVFIDVNNNGVYDPGIDEPLPNITINLYSDTNGNGVLDPGEPVVRTDVSDINGLYSFDDLPPGDYIVDVLNTDPDVPGGYFAARDLIPVTNLLEGQTVNTADFPFVPLIAKQVSDAEADPGDRLTYTVTVNYPGANLLNNVIITDTVPAGTTLVSGSVSGGLTTGTPGFSAASSGSVTLSADKDAMNDVGNAARNYGVSQELVVRRKADNSNAKRAFFEWDVSSLPDGARIDTAAFSFYVTGSRNVPIDLHRVTTEWVEGTQNNATCVGGGLTWTAANCGTTNWTAPGGDFNATILGAFTDAANDTRYTVASNANTVATVQIWADSDADNHGILLHKGTADDGDSKIASSDNPINQPARLAISWSLPSRSSSLSATPIDVAPAPGGTIQLSLQLTASFTVNNVTPATPTYLSGAGTCALTSPATQNVGPGGATWTWNCTPSGVGVVQFSVDATAGGLTFPAATSNPIVVANSGGQDIVFWSLGSNDPAVDGFRPGIGMCPQTTTLEATADTYVDQNAPTSNFGTGTEFFTRNHTTQRRTALMRFSADAMTLPAGSVLDSAVLLLTNNDSNANRTVELHAMTHTWTEIGATWNTSGSGAWTGATFSSSDYSATILGSIIPSPAQQWSISGSALKTVVAGWLSGGANSGFALVGVGTDTNAIGWDAREATVVVDRPQLVLHYLTPQVGDCQGDTDILAADTWIRQNDPAKNNGIDTVLELKNNAGDMRHALLNFDLNQLPLGAQINLVGLEFRVRKESDKLTGTVRALNASWTEGAGANATCTNIGIGGATWNAPNCTDNWLGGAFSATAYGSSLGGFTVDTPDADKYIDVTTTVQGWQTDPATNHGLVLLSGGVASGDTVEIYSGENTDDAPAPYLEVIWTISAAPASTAVLQAAPTLVSNGSQLEVSFVLSNLSPGKPITNVTPSNLLATTTLGNATAVCGAPSPAGPFDVIEGAPVTVVYMCTVSGATQVSEILFSADAVGSASGTAGLPYDFYTATSNSVIVAPPLTFQVDVDSPASVTEVDNVAYIRDFSGTISPTPSDMVQTLIGKPAVIGNRIWVDEDGDGLQDAGEDGLGNVTVELYAAGAIPGVDTPLAVTTTDANGGYLFGDLAFGDYMVYVDPASLPAGLAPNPTFDEDGVGTPHVANVTVIEGEEHLTTDFGYNWAPPNATGTPGPTDTGAIGDRIWNDADGNGIQDPGEAGLPDVTVRLLTDDNGDGIYGGVGDNPATTTTTNPDGTYIFDDLAPGSYVIEVDTATLPVGATYTQTGDPDATLDNRSEPIPLAPGDVFLNADFGYQPDSGSTIGDALFVDPNGNGIQDPGEPGLPGVTVALLDDKGNVIATDVTDANGNYSFPDLPAGTYTVWVTDSDNVLGDLHPISDPDGAGVTPNRSTTTVNGVADDLTQDFGYAPTFHDPGDGFIGDTIFLDRNGNNQPDTGEGLEGVTVDLYDATGTTLIATTTTDENGHYYFGGLDENATYVVRVDTATLPAGVTNSVDPDGGAANESTVDLALDPDGTNFDQDFGYTHPNPGSVSGIVWEDTDADGTNDEPPVNGLGGATVVLLDSDGNIIAQTTTQPDGSYSFSNVPPGNYTVDVTDDSNVLGGYWHSTNNDPAPVTVPAGGSDTADFGYYKEPGGIGNLVWEDIDGDGLKDPTETGLSGITVTLTITYPNGAIVTLVDVTGPDGVYSFDNLLLDEDFDGAGVGEPVYRIVTAVPAGYTSTYDGTPDGTGIGNGTDNNADNTAGELAYPAQGSFDNTNDFGLQGPEPGAIGNSVWIDENGNGMQDAGEPGLANVVVELYDSSAMLVGTALTDLNGNYLFSNVPPGDYWVQVDGASLPVGLFPTVPGAAGQDYNNQTQPYPVTIATGDENMTADFGYTWVDPANIGGNTGNGALGDRVWIDANGDGMQDPGEPGLPGASVQLYTDPDGDGVYNTPYGAPVLTGPDGSYIFTNLPPDGYVVGVTPPPGYAPTSGPAGEVIPLAPGDVYLNADFGFQPTGAAGVIGDTIWLDANGDGLLNGSEAGIPGVTVALLDAGGNVIATTTTDGNGNYSFPGLPDGSYTVWVNDTNHVLGEVAPTFDADGTGTPNQSTTTITGGNTDNDQDFGYAPAGQAPGDGLIGDTLYLDSDGSGAPDPGEGLEGVTVELLDNLGNVIATTTTDENGHYYFGNLPDGDYTVRVDTTTLPGGGVGMTNSVDPDGGLPNESDVTISGGNVDLGQDFGYTADNPATLSGTIWEDSDADGFLDEMGNGLAGVTVALFDSDGNIVATTTTDANGDYSFIGLPAGTYTVKVTDEAGLLDGYWHSLGAPTVDNNSQSDPYTVTLAVGATNTTADFGYYVEPAGLGDRVWSDLDADGIQDMGETGIAGVMVTLRIAYPDGSVVTLTTTTNTLGQYSFPNLLLDENFDGVGAGEPTYTLSFSQPQDSTPSPLNQGGDDTKDSDGLVTTPTVTQGVTDDTHDMGFIFAPTAVHLQSVTANGVNAPLLSLAVGAAVLSLGLAVVRRRR